MKILTLKIRIVVLWIFLAVSIPTEAVFSLFQIDNVVSGEVAGVLVLWTCRWLIPFVLAFLTVTLRDKANRITNLVWGAIFVAFNIFQFVMRAAVGQGLLPFLMVIILASIVASALILWYAIRWPKSGE